ANGIRPFMIQLREIHAYVLQKREASAEKAQVIFFSQELGRLSIWVNFKTKDKMRACYEPFQPLWITLKIDHVRMSIQSVEPEHPLNPLIGNGLWCGWYMNELLMYVLCPHEANEQLYQAYQTTLKALSETTEQQVLQVILRRFEWTLLQALGLAISLEQEGTGKGCILADKFYQCVPRLGLVEAETGFSGAMILSLAAGNWTHEGLLPVAKRMMRLLLDDALEGREIKTRTLLRSMYAVES
ncbi:MAG: DNA repair protein RecO C-terminal domain-containing protein, partial [Methylococcales bacterium]|nr:DNA repair protein RecO C-terminal domain-containing protein [Methylococcales bacterium]